jgi:hypothetical protein
LRCVDAHQGESAFAGTAWSVKNLLELKHARRVRVEGNVFESNWSQAQDGFAIVLTVRDFVFTHSIVAHNPYGIAGTDTGPGTQTLDAFPPGAIVERNVIVGGSSAQYPRDNLFPRSWDQVKFENLSLGRLRLAEVSPFRRSGLDGTDLGADMGVLPDTRRLAPAR